MKEKNAFFGERRILGKFEGWSTDEVSQAQLVLSQMIPEQQLAEKRLEVSKACAVSRDSCSTLISQLTSDQIRYLGVDKVPNRYKEKLYPENDSLPGRIKMMQAARQEIGMAGGESGYATAAKTIFSKNGGRAPEGMGVCTDLIDDILLKGVGYDLRAKFNASGLCPRGEENIAFRRVRMLLPFFKKSKDFANISTNPKSWKQGDIVTFGKSHIGVVESNNNGEIMMIHNDGLGVRREHINNSLLYAYTGQISASGVFRLV